MYEKYPTDAFVLSGRNRGEADRYYTLYTREFGLIRARCSSVRAERSKMRYALQTFSLSNVSLIRGRAGWRIAGAAAKSGIVVDARIGLLPYAALARISKLLERLLHGEEKSDYLFDSVQEARSALLQERSDADSIELLCVIRILFALGYIAPNSAMQPLFANCDYTDVMLGTVQAYKVSALGVVNAALSATQL